MAGVTISTNCYYHTGDGHLTVFGSFQAPEGTDVTVAVTAVELLAAGAGTSQQYTATGAVDSYERSTSSPQSARSGSAPGSWPPFCWTPRTTSSPPH